MTPLQTDTFIELHVPDFDRVLSFYEKLGFVLVWRRNDAKGYMVLRRGKSVLNFYSGSEAVYEQSYFKKFPHDTPRGYAVEIVIPVDNIDLFYTEILAKIPDNIVFELAMKPWGVRDFRIIDPFGFYLRFTERYDWINQYPMGTVIDE